MGDHEPLIVMSLDRTQRAVLDAAGVCMARWGVTKTTVADLAREAGCSRATVYRSFPGGKNQIIATYGLCELQAFFADASQRVAESPSLEDALVSVITGAARALADHSGFQFMLAHEPGLALPYLGFTNIDRLYTLVATALADDFERFVGDGAGPIVELAARITLSHTFQPSEALDLRDPDDVRALVRRHLIPVALSYPSKPGSPGTDSSLSARQPTAIPA